MQGARVQSLVREIDLTCMLQLRLRPQLRSPQAATKEPTATTKTQRKQIKKEMFKKIKKKRNDASLAFNGAGGDGILERNGRQILQGNVRRPIIFIEANSTCCVVLGEEARGWWKKRKTF